MKLTGNTILITGGSSGIGFEWAKQLIALGNVVIVTGLDQSRLDRAKKSLPALYTFRSDVSNPQDVTSLYEQVTREFPALNILINNAGIMKSFNLNAYDGELGKLTSEVDVNLNGTIWMSQQFLPHLKKQASAAIVNTSSLLAIVPMPISPIYSATKAAVRSFSISLRGQLKHSSVKVFELAPPATQTNLMNSFDKGDTAELGSITAEELVHKAIKGMQNDNFDIRPGQSNLIYYVNKFAPKYALRILSKSLDRMLAGDDSHFVN